MTFFIFVCVDTIKIKLYKLIKGNILTECIVILATKYTYSTIHK